MKKTLLTFGLLLITILTFGQQIKYVDTEELNIRAGAGTKYEVVDKISQGQKVTVLTEHGKWSEIELENGTKGFVSAKFLSDTQTSNNPNSSDKKNSWIGYVLVIGIVLYGLKKLFGGSSSSSNSGSNSQPRERREKPQPKQEPIHICKHCGYEDKNLKSLTFFTCHRSPTKKHQPLEGGVKEIYYCKHCGYQDKNLKSLTFFTCHRSPTGKHQPHV